MTREDYIKSLIKSNGYNLKAFAKHIRMPYTTLLSILNGSIGGAALDNVLKICTALNVQIEELEQVSEKSPSETSPEDQKELDAHLARLIHDLPMEKQIALKILLNKL